MADTASPKPGWKTTEFWVTVATAVVTGLVLLGYVPQASSDQVTSMVVDLAVKGVSLLTSAWTVIAYVLGRLKAKSDAARLGGEGEESGDLADGDTMV